MRVKIVAKSVSITWDYCYSKNSSTNQQQQYIPYFCRSGLLPLSIIYLVCVLSLSTCVLQPTPVVCYSPCQMPRDYFGDGSKNTNRHYQERRPTDERLRTH